MTFPTITINGSTRNMLIEPIRETYYALTEVLEKLPATAPNGRDYPTEDLKKAESEYNSRVERIKSVQDELLAIFENLDA